MPGAPAAATTVVALGPAWLDPTTLLTALGPWVLAGMALIIFAECGLLVGFFLPGDSLLFTAGLFVAAGTVTAPLWLVCLVLVTAALAGNVAGYAVGRIAGPRLFDRPDSRWLRREHLRRTERFFERFGNRAVVLARFVPIVRTFVTVLAGAGRMPPRRYLAYSTLGALAWAAGVTVAGYLLGGIPVVRDHVDLMLVGVVALSLVPLGLEALAARRRTRSADRG